MIEIEDSGPAFPVQDASKWQAHGMTLRQYAAIKLKVPDSGTEWMDEMITTSLRDDFAAKVIQSFVASAPNGTGFGVRHAETNLTYARAAYAMADAMLEARSK